MVTSHFFPAILKHFCWIIKEQNFKCENMTNVYAIYILQVHGFFFIIKRFRYNILKIFKLIFGPWHLHFRCLHFQQYHFQIIFGLFRKKLDFYTFKDHTFESVRQSDQKWLSRALVFPFPDLGIYNIFFFFNYYCKRKCHLTFLRTY